jgi:hypothetical protein
LAKLDTIFNFINFCVKAWQGKSEFSKPWQIVRQI